MNLQKWRRIALVALIASIVAMVLALLVYSSLTDSWGDAVLADVQTTASPLGSALEDVSQEFNTSFHFFELFMQDNHTESINFQTTMDSIFLGALSSSEFVDDYFMDMPSVSSHVRSRDKAIHNEAAPILNDYSTEKKPLWDMVSTTSGRQSLVYIIPYWTQEMYRGYVGFSVNLKALQEIYLQGTAKAEDALLLSDGRIVYHPTLAAGTRITDSDKYKTLTDLTESGVMRLETNNGRLTLAHYTILSSLVFLRETHDVHPIIQYFPFVVLALLFMGSLILFYAKNRNGEPYMDILFDRIFKLHLENTTAVEQTRIRAAFFIQFVIALMLGYNLLVQLSNGVTGIPILLLALALGAMIYLLLAFHRMERFVIMTTLIAIIAPPVFNVYLIHETGHFASGGELLWLIPGIIAPLYIRQRQLSSLYFPLGVFMIFLALTVQPLLLHITPDENTLTFYSSLFFVTLALMMSVSIFVKRSDNTYQEMQEAMEQLQSAQSSLVQREKMVTLGKLIAGVAHEINTPIGAVNASAETLDATNNTFMYELFNAGRSLDDQDFTRFTRLVAIATDSFKEMRSTSEVRRARTQMRQYLQTLPLDNRDEVQLLLERMEICDIEKVEQNIDLFTCPNALPILQLTLHSLPMLTSIQTILLATQKVSKIVFALKSFSHTATSQGHELVQTNVRQSIDTVLLLYHNQIKNNVRVIMELDPALPSINANADELSQVWTNLLQNGIHAMQGAGILTIRGGVYEDVTGQYIEVSITDTGCGISDEDISHIFEPFFTTKPMGEGSGLGLDICRRIIMAHGGTIAAHSEIGQGTTFSVTLPVST